MVESPLIIGDGILIMPSDVLAIDTSDVENLRITVKTLYHGDHVITGIQALETLMAFKPSVLENRRLRWARHAWSVHNLIGHPVMQVLAWFKMYELAMKVHDITVPKPKGSPLSRACPRPASYSPLIDN